MLDAEAISDIDTTGAEALKQALEYLRKHKITFALARAYSCILEWLDRYEYETNRDAVEAFLCETGQRSTHGLHFQSSD